MSGHALFPGRPRQLGGKCLERTVFRVLGAPRGPAKSAGDRVPTFPAAARLPRRRLRPWALDVLLASLSSRPVSATGRPPGHLQGPIPTHHRPPLQPTLLPPIGAGGGETKRPPATVGQGIPTSRPLCLRPPPPGTARPASAYRRGLGTNGPQAAVLAARVPVCLSCGCVAPGRTWVCEHHLFLREWKRPESRARSPPPTAPPSGAWETHAEPNPLGPPAAPLRTTGLPPYPDLNISPLNLHTSSLPGHSQLETCQRSPHASSSGGRGRSQAPDLGRCVHCGRHTVCIR